MSELILETKCPGCGRDHFVNLGEVDQTTVTCDRCDMSFVVRRARRAQTTRSAARKTKGAVKVPVAKIITILCVLIAALVLRYVFLVPAAPPQSTVAAPPPPPVEKITALLPAWKEFKPDASLAGDLRILRERESGRREKSEWSQFVPAANQERLEAQRKVLEWNRAFLEDGARQDDANGEVAALLAGTFPLVDYRSRVREIKAIVDARRERFASMEGVVKGAPPLAPVPAEAPLPFPLTQAGEKPDYRQAVENMAAAGAVFARYTAAARGGAPAAATWTADAPLAKLYGDEPGLAAARDRIRTRAIIMSAANDLVLLNPPTPEVLRKMIRTIESLPDSVKELSSALQAERAAARELLPDDARRWPEERGLAMMAWGMRLIDDAEARPDFAAPTPADPDERARLEAFSRAPAACAGRNRRTLDRFYDEILGALDKHNVSDEAFGWQALHEIERRLATWRADMRKSRESLREQFATVRPPEAGQAPDYGVVGSGGGDGAVFAYALLPLADGDYRAFARIDAYRRALAVGLEILASRLEGKAYPTSSLPDNPLTGRPFMAETRDGLWVIRADASDESGQSDVRLPLFAGDPGSDARLARRFGWTAR